MKLITTAIASIVCFLGTSASADTAQKVSFSYSDIYSAYSCDYAEMQTTAALKTLGATDIKVTCSGGLPYEDVVFVSASFKTGTTGDWASVKLTGRESCDFNENVVRALLPHFTTKNVKSHSTCWHSEGSFEYDLDVLN